MRCIFQPAKTIFQTGKKEINIKDLSGNEESILLIEDEETVRKISRDILQRNGYTVYVAKDGKEGREQFFKYQDEIVLIFSDVVLPGIHGVDLVNEFLKIRPDLSVLMCSGYAEGDIELSEIKKKGYQFIQKPFNVNGLLCKVKETILSVKD